MIYTKAMMGAFALMIAAVVLASQGQTARTTDIEKAVLEQLTGIQDAAENMDVEAVFSYMLENDKGSLISDGRLMLTRQEARESTKRGFEGLEKVSYKFDRQFVNVLSPTIAVAIGEGTSSVTTLDGRSFVTPFAQTVVFVLTDGEWKISHAHRSFPRAR